MHITRGKFNFMDESCVGSTLNFEALAAENEGLGQKELVDKFCNDDNIFLRMNRMRRVLDDEPAKQQLISKSLWYFADKTLDETTLIWNFITEGRWKPDWSPPADAQATEVDLPEDDETDSEPIQSTEHSLFDSGATLRDLLAKRLAKLEEDEN